MENLENLRKKLKICKKILRDFSGTKSHFRGQIGDKQDLRDFLGIFFAKRDKKGQILAGPGDFLKNRVAPLFLVYTISPRPCKNNNFAFEHSCHFRGFFTLREGKSPGISPKKKGIFYDFRGYFCDSTDIP